MLVHIRSLTATAALALSSLAGAPASAYQIDCAILLCMAGGFPSDPVCAAAYAEMIRRVTPWPVEPPLQVWRCPMGASPISVPAELEPWGRLLHVDYRPGAALPFSPGLPAMTAAAIPVLRAAAPFPRDRPSLLSDLLVYVQTLGADMDLSGPEYDFVRTLRVFHVRAEQYEDQEESGDVCRRSNDTEIGTYDAQGRFEWQESAMGDLPATFVRPAVVGGCARYDVQSVFIEWRDYQGVYDFERIDY